MLLQSREEKLQSLRKALVAAQDKMRAQANKYRTPMSFEVGQLVLVKLQPYRQISVAHRQFNKLNKRYFGPFEIIKRIGTVAYKLKLPEDSRIHPVFHISLLKKFKGSN